MCVSLGVGLLLQLHLDEPKPVCPILRGKMGELKDVFLYVAIII